MRAAPERPLAEQRRLLQAQLHTQRETLALELAAATQPRYPRSFTMRLLLRRPALVIGVVSVLAGALFGGRVRALNAVVRALSALPVA